MSAVEELTRLDQAVDRAANRLLELQHPGGWWVGELESNATMITEHLFWLHVLGLSDPETDRRLANDILARQRDDGTWSNWWQGPADLSTTMRYVHHIPQHDAAQRLSTVFGVEVNPLGIRESATSPVSAC